MKESILKNLDLNKINLEDFIENQYNGMDLEIISQILESIDAAKKADKPFEY